MINDDNDDESAAQPYIDAIEWEPLRREVQGAVSRILSETGDFGTLTVRRDAEYRIAATLVTNDRAEWIHRHTKAVPGTVGGGIEIAATLHGQEGLLLPKARLTRWNHRWKPNHDTTTIQIGADHVVWKLAGSTAPALLVDWFIGGPESDSVALWRSTKRRHAGSFARTRTGMTSGVVEHEFVSAETAGGITESGSRDHLTLTLPSGPVRICQVPPRFAPLWTRPFGFEYSMGAEPPPEDLRHGVVEALGFMFGRHILRVGTTIFDSAGHSLSREAISPWGHDVIRTVGQPDRPAVPMFGWETRHQNESTLSSVTAAYLAARDELNLSHAVWTMWMAARMAVSFETPLYAAALEAVMKGWFASNQSKTKAVYMSVEDFRKVFADAIEMFRTTAEGVKYGDRILRKISGANAMSVNERFDTFFEEIELAVGEGEAAVIRSRNISAHGTKSDRHPHDLVVLGSGYRTLLNRVILKLLGFNGQYIDYSTVGHPSRALDEPIGYRSPARS
jgi:hypothetical protein